MAKITFFLLLVFYCLHPMRLLATVSLSTESKTMQSIFTNGASSTFGFFTKDTAVIWVSTQGSDQSEGTASSPLKTLAQAFRMAREWRRLNLPEIQQGIIIRLLPGSYFLNETVVVRPEDSGTPQSPTIVEGLANFNPNSNAKFSPNPNHYPNGSTNPQSKVVVSGGITIQSWTVANELSEGMNPKLLGKVWKAKLPAELNGQPTIRQLWVNGNAASRSLAVSGPMLPTLVQWNSSDGSCLINADDFKANFRHGMEMMIQQWWAVAWLRIKSIEPFESTPNNGKQQRLLRIEFFDPERKLQQEHPWPAPWIHPVYGNSPFLLSNAPEWFDQPGEFFVDQARQQIYYYPKPNENIEKITAVAPFLEQLIYLKGVESISPLESYKGTAPVKDTDPLSGLSSTKSTIQGIAFDPMVSHIYFRGIEFAHGGFFRPNHYGHVPIQAGMYLTEAYRIKPTGTSFQGKLDNQGWIGKMPGMIALSNAKHIQFQGCSFVESAAHGMVLSEEVRHVQITGNLFTELGGSSLVAGYFGEDGREIHLPLPSDGSAVKQSDLIFENNLVEDVATEDWGAAGLTIGYAKRFVIRHNEFRNLPYTAVSLGWGWNAYWNGSGYHRLEQNYIHRYAARLYDVAGIYTLGAQPGTRIANNYIGRPFKAWQPHIPSHWFYIYTDEGSSHLTITNNYTAESRFLQNANGPFNRWHNNGPDVWNDSIAWAGPLVHFESPIRPSSYNSWRRNLSHPIILQISIQKKAASLAKKGKGGTNESDAQKSVEFLQKAIQEKPLLAGSWNKIFLYEKQIWVLLNPVDVLQLTGYLERKFPEWTIKTFEEPFYQFFHPEVMKKAPQRKLKPIDKHGNGLKNSLLEEDFEEAYPRVKEEEWDHELLATSLVEDSSKVQAYLQAHARQRTEWPEVAKGFEQAGFQRLLVFKLGYRLLVLISLPKGKTLSSVNHLTWQNNPRVLLWNEWMGTFQQPLPEAKKDEVWIQPTTIIK